MSTPYYFKVVVAVSLEIEAKCSDFRFNVLKVWMNDSDWVEQWEKESILRPILSNVHPMMAVEEQCLSLWYYWVTV